jgi:hypothetical protein
LTERRKRPIPPDGRDFELAKRIDARIHPMGAMTKMNASSPISRAMHSGMGKRVKHEDNAIPMPTKHVMAVSRRPLPAPVKKEVESDAEKLLKVAKRRNEILENEKQRLVEDIETLKKAYIELRDKPTEIQELLDRRGFATVEELEKFIIDAKESKRKARIRKERYDRKHGYA